MEPPLKRGDIIVGTGNRVVRVDPVSGETGIITEGGEIGNAVVLGFEAHPHIIVVTGAS